MPRATIDLPEPVGVPRMTWSPSTRSMMASSWWGHSSMPRSRHHCMKSSKISSPGISGSPSCQMGARLPSEPVAKASSGEPWVSIVSSAMVDLSFRGWAHGARCVQTGRAAAGMSREVQPWAPSVFRLEKRIIQVAFNLTKFDRIGDCAGKKRWIMLLSTLSITH